MEIRGGFQQLPCLSYIELGLWRSCCSQVLLQQFGTLTSPTPRAWAVPHLPGLEERLVKSTSGGRLCEAWQIKYQHGRTLPSLSTFASFWPMVEKSLSPQTTLEEAQDLTRKKKTPNHQNPLHSPGLELLFWHLLRHPNSRAEPGKEFTCLVVGGRRSRLCVTQPGPSRPRRHEAQGQVFLGFISYFQVPGCHTDTETRREPRWKELKAQSSVHEVLGVSPTPRSVPGGRTFPPFHPLCYQPTKGTAFCPQLHLWGISQGQISPKKGW